MPLLNGIASIWNAPKYSVGFSPGGNDDGNEVGSGVVNGIVGSALESSFVCCCIGSIGISSSLKISMDFGRISSHFTEK